MIPLYFSISHLLCVSLSAPGNSNAGGNSNNNSNSTSDPSSDGGSSTPDLGSATPNETMILELGMNNVYWTPEQLRQIDGDVFLKTVVTLGKVTDYSEDQLAALKVLALKVLCVCIIWI